MGKASGSQRPPTAPAGEAHGHAPPAPPVEAPHGHKPPPPPHRDVQPGHDHPAPMISGGGATGDLPLVPGGGIAQPFVPPDPHTLPHPFSGGGTGWPKRP